MTTIKFFKLAPEVAIPALATESAACFDLQAWITPEATIKVWQEYDAAPQNAVIVDSSFTLAPFARALVPTGLIADIPSGYSLRVHPRSGLAVKNGVTLINAEGVIDEDYVEPIYVTLWNTSKYSFTVKNKDRIAQAELRATIATTLIEIAERPTQKTSRAGGFGSTGVAST